MNLSGPALPSRLVIEKPYFLAIVAEVETPSLEANPSRPLMLVGPGHADADRELDPAPADLGQPAQHPVHVELDLGEHRARDLQLRQRGRLALERRPEHVGRDVRVAVGVAADGDVLDAVPLEHARLDQRERVLVGAERDGRVAADGEHGLGRVDRAQRREELLEHPPAT